MNGVPGYWMNETSGVLRPAVEAYLQHRPMTPEQIAAMRAYCRQWINAPGFLGPDIEALRNAVDGLTTSAAISAWMEVACLAGVDPL